MTPSQSCVDLVKSFEGCKLEAYRDIGGVWTIGYGHTRGVYAGMAITPAQAEQLLDEDLDETAGYVTAAVHVPLTQPQFDALVSFAFNVKGWRGSTLLKLVNAREYAAAAEEFHKWDHVGKAEVAGLLRRRDAEQKMFLQSA